MKYDDIFKHAYLQQLNIIKEDADTEVDDTNAVEEPTEECNNTIAESDIEECCKNGDCDECGTVNEDADEVEDTDDTDETDDVQLQEVVFKTTDPALIDALNSGFEEVVFFVNTKDEETGEDKIEEVKFGKDSFGDLVIREAETTESETDAEFDGLAEEDGEEETEEVDGGEEVDDAGEEAGEIEECKAQLNECNKLLASLKAQRASKYGPY